MHDAAKTSHQTEDRQRNGTLLVGVLYSVDNYVIFFCVRFFFLKVAIRQMKEKPRKLVDSLPSDDPGLEKVELMCPLSATESVPCHGST